MSKQTPKLNPDTFQGQIAYAIDKDDGDCEMRQVTLKWDELSEATRTALRSDIKAKIEQSDG